MSMIDWVNISNKTAIRPLHCFLLPARMTWTSTSLFGIFSLLYNVALRMAAMLCLFVNTSVFSRTVKRTLLRWTIQGVPEPNYMPADLFSSVLRPKLHHLHRTGRPTTWNWSCPLLVLRKMSWIPSIPIFQFNRNLLVWQISKIRCQYHQWYAVYSGRRATKCFWCFNGFSSPNLLAAKWNCYWYCYFAACHGKKQMAQVIQCIKIFL